MTWSPRVTPQGLLAVAAAALAITLAVTAWRSGRFRNGLLAALLIALTFPPAVVAVRGLDAGYVRSIRPTTLTQYPADVPLARELGARRFAQSWADLLEGDRIRSIHSVSHPPGPVVVLAALEDAWPGHPLPQAMVLWIVAALVVLPAGAIGRILGGDRAGIGAALLTAATPAIVLHGIVSIDASTASLLVAATALTMTGILRGGWRVFLAGVVAALCAFFTYAIVFPVFAAFVWGSFRRPLAVLARRAALAALGGVAGLLLLDLVTGFNALTGYGATHAALVRLTAETDRPWLYWILGAPTAWLLAAGIPLAGLTVVAVARRDRLVGALALVFLAVAVAPQVLGLIPGETERTWLFAYPIAAGGAGMALARAEVSPRFIGILTAVATLQAIILEALFFWPW